MKDVRKVRSVSKSVPTLEGAGVRLRRAFGKVDPYLDPFLLLDDFHSQNPSDYNKGFPWHPHRGIETITYMLYGNVRHGDSMGNKGVIGPGDVQWMTAGSGIIHEEMPEQDYGLLWGFQLWANLPAASKMMDPRYRDIKAGQIPEAHPAEGVAVKIICGNIGDVVGPVTDVVIAPTYFDVILDSGATFSFDLPEQHNAFAYTMEGTGDFDSETGKGVGKETLVIFEKGDSVEIKAGQGGLRFLFVAGKPIGEPVAWRGPIVMNTEKELAVAFKDYARGTFIKK